jgi:hypothetical protein
VGQEGKHVSVGKRTVVAVVLIGGSVLLYDFGWAMIWDGDFPLTVTLQPAEPDRISRVWVAPVSHQVDADEILYDHDSPDRTLKEVANFREPFVVYVTCSWKSSGFARECWYAQYRVLVLCVEYADGRREFRIVGIPNGKQTQEVTIQLPLQPLRRRMQPNAL